MRPFPSGIPIALHSGLTDIPLSDESAPVWQPGDRLTLRGREWTVARWTPFADCEALRVDDAAASTSRTFLLPFERPRRVSAGRPAVVSLRAWMHTFASILLDARSYGGLQDWPAGLDLLPYQLEPALAMLRDGHPRLLIADDVGLGKTIETGLILRELSRCKPDFKALILMPAGLRRQWQDELMTRFGIESALADAEWLRIMNRCLPPDINPWSPPGIYIASFDFVKRPEALRPLEDVRWDLLVVDEAHAASMATDRRAAVHGIALRSRRLVLLTATPPVDRSQFDALCQIGALPSEPGIVLFQRARSAGGRRPRRSVLLSVRLDEAEQHLHRMLEHYTTLVWREARRSGNRNSGLFTTTLRKRALSSIASLSASLRRRRDLRAAFVSPLELQMLLPLDRHGEESVEDTVGDDVLLAAGLHDTVDEDRWLETLLIAAAVAAESDSKSRVLTRLLKRIRQPALVFTEYRDTLEALRLKLLASGIAVCALHGGLSSEERRRVLEDFARGGKTLLATDAAGEGLNLQRVCRVIVHYELPWNPSRMLQRAGRVDRIGQHQRVHEIALVAADTAESLVLAPLARRALGWSGDAGGRMLQLLTESRVAALIFDGGAVPNPIDAAGQDNQHTSINLSEDADVEGCRHEQRQALRTAFPTRSDQRPGNIPVSTLRRSSWPPGCVLLFDIRASAVDRSVIASVPLAVHVELALPLWPHRRREIRKLIEDLLPALRAATAPNLEAPQRRQGDEIHVRYREAVERLQRRSTAIRRNHESVARQLVQGGLFERGQKREATAGRDELGFDDTSEDAASNELMSAADVRAVLIVRPR